MPRVAVQDMTSSLSLRATTSIVDCGTDCIGTGDVTVMGWVKAYSLGSSSAGRIITNGVFYVYMFANNVYRVSSNGGGTVAVTANEAMPKGKWHHLAVTRTASGVVNIRVNSSISGSPNQPSGTPSAAITNMFIGNQSTPDVAFDGLLKNWTIVPRICTQSEIQAHMNGVTPSDATRIFKMNEGAGSILYDSSANAVNGTITSGTWVADTPTKNRQAIGVNMVVNGDFSLIPPTNVAHTANSATWLDGSSSGSATNNLFGWGKLASTITGSHTAIFDTSEKRSGVASLKVSLTAPLSNVTVASTLTTTQAGMASCIPVLPSTSYSYSVWMKTNLVSGSALTGAYASFSERTSSGTMVIQNNTPNQLTTTGWTRYSGSFTTSPTTSYIMPKAVVTGNEAAGTLIMDAWFDDFTLVPTYPVSRTTVQDMNASLSLRASTSKVNCGVDVIGVGDVTVMGWVKAYSLGSSSAGRIITNGVFYVYMFANNVYRVSSNGGGTVAVTANEAMPKGKWHHLAVTRTASGVVNIRVNSSISGSPNQPSGTPSAAITNMFIGNQSTPDVAFDGLLKNWTIVPRICTQSEIQAHMNGVTPSDATRIFKMNEGAGSILYDSSANAVNGTITSGTWVADVPSKKRAVVGGNMVYNGDFEYAPPFTAATTTQFKWVDGTAAGNDNPYNIFGWGVESLSGTGSARFDTTEKYFNKNTMKLSVASGGSIIVSQKANSSFRGSTIPILPNTSYTASAYIKTNVISGTANAGAILQIRALLGDNSTSSTLTNVSSGIKTTQGWTAYTATFTTGANDRFLKVMSRIQNDGAATLVMDAWFADIQLRPTTPTPRGIA